MVGTRTLGPYELVRRMGKGMTDVYLAFDTSRKRSAVLKIIEHANDAVTRLVLEAERRGAAIQKQLHDFDPRVIQIYDSGDLDDCFYVAMEYVAGENVAEILRRDRRMDPRRAAQIALAVASQLERLHSFEATIDGQRAAVVHGDIKPSNIQVGADGSIRLLDFGIAKRITEDHNLTRHDFGSPSYCSPERLDRAHVDRQADLWSLGVTLYEMVAGAPPYQAESTRRLENLIQSRRPPRALPMGCPRALKAVISKALAPDPAQRYESAGALHDDLARFLANRETEAEREKRGPWKVNPTVERKPVAHALVRAVSALVPTRADRDFTLRPSRIAAALGCLLIGMLAFVGGSYAWRYHVESDQASTLDWDMFRALQKQYSRISRFHPANGVEQALRQSNAAAGTRVIEAYRDAATSALEKFDWHQAQSALEHADVNDAAVKSKLALCRGYQDLLAGRRNEARRKFEEAAEALPQSPDPHLALARIYARAADLPRALAEFRAAEKLGYALKPREFVQQADAYRFRALRERRSAPAQARRDLQTSWRLYGRARRFPKDWDESVRQVRSAATPAKKYAKRGSRWR